MRAQGELGKCRIIVLEERIEELRETGGPQASALCGEIETVLAAEYKNREAYEQLVHSEIYRGRREFGDCFTHDIAKDRTRFWNERPSKNA